jgi:hypothetical protein
MEGTSLGSSINSRTRFGQTLLRRYLSQWQFEMLTLFDTTHDQTYFNGQNGADDVSSGLGLGEYVSMERTLQL